MKNEYTQEQISEAIEYWKGKLKEKEIDEGAVNDFMSKYSTVVKNDGLVKLSKIINNLKTVDEGWVILGCIVGKDKYPVTGFSMSVTKEKAFKLFSKAPLVIECDPQNQLTNKNTKTLKDLLDAMDDQLGKGVKAVKALSGIALKVGDKAAPKPEDSKTDEKNKPSIDDADKADRAVTRLIDMNKLVDVTYNGKGCIFFKFDESSVQKADDEKNSKSGTESVGRGHF